MSGFFAGAVMMTFFAPAARCLAAASRFGEEAGRLEHDVDAEVLPRQLRRVLDRQDLELVLVDRDAVALGRDVRLQVAEDRVVLEQVRERLRVGEIVDRDDIDAASPMAARMMLRPMRPNPLIPTLMAISQSSNTTRAELRVRVFAANS